MIVFLVEEESMSVTIRQVLSKICADSIEGVDWLSLHFQGKQDLERNIRPKMKSWNFGNPHFIILRDQDGADCKILKEKLRLIAAESTWPHHIRIVCQELESWFLGDLNAVERAYPDSKASQHINKAKFRAPDRLPNASQILEDLTGISGKVGRAHAIAEHLILDQCRSASFHVMLNTVKSLIP